MYPNGAGRGNLDTGLAVETRIFSLRIFSLVGSATSFRDEYLSAKRSRRVSGLDVATHHLAAKWAGDVLPVPT